MTGEPSTIIRIQSEDFDVGAELDRLVSGRSEIGATVSFTGLVRADGGLASMTLEHYPAMTEREIARHVGEARARWPLNNVTVIHRVGTLKPGERIVLVATSSQHRQAAFSAAEFLMDYLKTLAPFWKLEQRDDTSSWVDAKTSDEDAADRWQQPRRK